MGDKDEAVILTAVEAAIMLRISCQTLETMRFDGRGPRYVRLASGSVGRVVYLLSDIVEWLERHSGQ